MNIVLLGAPGTGKSLQSDLISKEYSIPHISIGHILRENVANNTDLGMIARPYLEKGELIPNSISIPLITDRLLRANKGFVLDGFPRNIKDANALDIIMDESNRKLDLAIHIDVDDETLIGRLLARGRPDDIPEVIVNRFVVYRRETEPVLEYYRNRGLLVTIDGKQSVQEIFEDIKELLNQY